MKIVTRLVAIGLVVGVLGACSSIEQKRLEDRQVCNGMGFKDGTEAYSNCLLELEVARRGGTTKSHARHY